MQKLPTETTVYSMSPTPPPKSNRRGDERHLTLFRVGTLIVGDRRELCLVKNISAGGVLIRTFSTLQPEMVVQVELNEGQPLPGRVTWTKDSDAGIALDERVDVVDVLKTTTDGPRPRMPRVQLSCAGFVREGASLHRAVLQNISQGGVGVETAKPLTVGSDVTVSLPGLAPQQGVVRWSDGRQCGITFNSVVPLAALVEWLHARG